MNELVSKGGTVKDKPEERPKRIRLTVEWIGACSEANWAAVLTEMIEEVDYSRVARVTEVTALTGYGTTKEISAMRLRELGFRPRPWPPRTTWLERLRRALWGWGER